MTRPSPKQLARRWARLAAFHEKAANLASAIAKAKRNGSAWHGLISRFHANDRRGGKHRAELLDLEERQP